GGGLGDEHCPLVGDVVHDVHPLVSEVEILGAAVVVIGLPVHEAVVDQAADRGGDVGGAQEAQPSDLGDTAARVLGDELQHLDRGLGDVHIRARAAHEAARGGEEVEDAGRDFGDVDVR